MGPVVVAPGTEILNQVLRMEGVKRWKQFKAFSKKRGGASPAIKLVLPKKSGGASPAIKLVLTKKSGGIGPQTLCSSPFSLF